MKITEVRIFPTESKDGKLKAFATMTFDDWFVVRNVKIIQGTSGLFVAMPSRKAVDSCPKCSFKNARGSRFCNQCGSEISIRIPSPAEDSRRTNSHMDIAHPITQECRVYIQDHVLEEYGREMTKQQAEGSAYRPPSEDDLNVMFGQLAGDARRMPSRTSGTSPVFDSPNDIEL